MNYLLGKTIYSIEPLTGIQVDNVSKSLNCELIVVDRTTFFLQYDIHSSIEILICRDRDQISEILDVCPNLKFIFIVSVGVERLPFDKLIERKVVVANTSGINAEIMSQYAIGAILSFSTRIIENYSNQQNNFWKKFQCVESLDGKNLLVIGAGRTGQLIAKKAQTFGMHCTGIKTSLSAVDYFDCIGTLDDINSLLPEADYVVCTIPLTNATENLFNKHTFKQFKDSAVFINISRGRILVENDLIEALNTKQLRGAVLDVFTSEPLLPDNAMWNTPNLLVSPHSSGRLDDFMDKAIDIFIDNMKDYLNGMPLGNLVNLKKGY